MCYLLVVAKLKGVYQLVEIETSYSLREGLSCLENVVIEIFVLCEFEDNVGLFVFLLLTI